MKATGIVRRIDDLGRIVVPKEIRRTLRLREGTPLEIFTDREGEIILKKYSPICRTVRRGDGTVYRVDGVYYRQRSGNCRGWGTKKGHIAEEHQPTVRTAD